MLRTSARLLLLPSLLLTACASELADRGRGDSPGGGESGADDTGGGGTLTCTPIALQSLSATTANAMSTGKGDRITPSCNPSGGSPDLFFSFTAPSDGYYEFDTLDTAFDTALAVLDGDCFATELACNDDDGGGVQSRVGLTLEAGQVVTIVVDGVDGGEGLVRLAARQVDQPCNDSEGGVVDCSIPACADFCSGGIADWPGAWAGMEAEVLRLVNQARATGYDCDTEGSFGPAGALTMHELLRGTARRMSKDMGERGFFDHVDPDGHDPFDRMEAAGYAGGAMGENIAAGQETAAEVVQGWLDSDGHCSNIMDPDFRVIGVGYALVPGSPYRHYWTQNFGDQP
jgi:uncharacterized protein YkwD